MPRASQRRQALVPYPETLAGGPLRRHGRQAAAGHRRAAVRSDQGRGLPEVEGRPLLVPRVHIHTERLREGGLPVPR